MPEVLAATLMTRDLLPINREGLYAQRMLRHGKILEKPWFAL
jgi:hypothetical protein